MRSNLLTAAALAAVMFNSHGMEPLADRAQIHSMNAELLLPDGGLLPVDVSFDCGSVYNNTAMIITSEQGAELLAMAYSKLWGPAAGQQVMAKWHNKVNPDDPRKPTFIFVTPPAGAHYDGRDNERDSEQNKYNPTAALTAEHDLSSKADNPASLPPTLIGSCGTRDHH